MSTSRPTIAALLLGTMLGFALAASSGVLASRRLEPHDLAGQDARLMAEVIERVRDEYVEPVGNHELMQHAIRGMVSGLDAYSAYLDQGELEDLRIASEGSYSGIGIEVSYENGLIVVVSPIEGSPADRAGLRSGDVVVAIDGKAVRASGLGESVARMRGAPGTRVSITLEREGIDEPIAVIIERARIEVHSVRQTLLEPGYGYLRISQFSETTLEELQRGFLELRRQSGRPLTAMVLDLRGNPGGMLEAGVEVADAFLDEGVIVSASGRTPDSRFHMMATPGDISDGARLAVLVNGGSASASEIVAAALKDHGRAVLIGRTTFGKGSVQTVLPLSGGDAVKLTTSHYYTPSGSSIHEKGILPDVVLPRDETSVQRPVAAPGAQPGDDPEIAAALDVLKSQALPRLAGERASPGH